MDTPKKSTHVLSPQITDKLSHLELTKPSNYGTPDLIANSHLKPTTTTTGSHALDTLHSSKHKTPKLTSNHTLPQLDGTENSKSGTPISKLDIPSNHMMDKSTLLLSVQTENILPPEVKINKSTSGISPT